MLKHDCHFRLALFIIKKPISHFVKLYAKIKNFKAEKIRKNKKDTYT